MIRRAAYLGGRLKGSDSRISQPATRARGRRADWPFDRYATVRWSFRHGTVFGGRRVASRSQGNGGWHHGIGGSRETGGPEGPPVIGAGKRRGLPAHHPEAIGAVDRTRPGRPERDLRL